MSAPSIGITVFSGICALNSSARGGAPLAERLIYAGRAGGWLGPFRTSSPR